MSRLSLRGVASIAAFLVPCFRAFVLLGELEKCESVGEFSAFGEGAMAGALLVTVFVAVPIGLWLIPGPRRTKQWKIAAALGVVTSFMAVVLFVVYTGHRC